MDTLAKHRDNYRQALKNKDFATVHREKARLTTAAATALLTQDAEAMQAIRACCADLSGLADYYDESGKPGDRWRTLGELMTLALASGKPLEQLRLVLPSTVSGLAMKHIKQQPGITPTELARRCEKEPSHIANELKKLEDAGLIYRLKRGKTREVYLSILGKETLDNIAPVKVAESAKTETKKNWHFPYADKSREEILGKPTAVPFAKCA
jgi:DNA-binding MarR family transcriptional regulator